MCAADTFLINFVIFLCMCATDTLKVFSNKINKSVYVS